MAGAAGGCAMVEDDEDEGEEDWDKRSKRLYDIVSKRMQRQSDKRGSLPESAAAKAAAVNSIPEAKAVIDTRFDEVAVTRKYDGIGVVLVARNLQLGADNTLVGELYIQCASSGTRLLITQTLRRVILKQIGDIVGVTSSCEKKLPLGESYEWIFNAELAKKPDRKSPDEKFHSMMAYYRIWIHNWVWEATMQAANARFYLFCVTVKDLKTSALIFYSFLDFWKMTKEWSLANANVDHGERLWNLPVVQPVLPIEVNIGGTQLVEICNTKETNVEAFLQCALEIGTREKWEGLIIVGVTDKAGKPMHPKVNLPQPKPVVCNGKKPQRRVVQVKGNEEPPDSPYTMDWLKLKNSELYEAYVVAKIQNTVTNTLIVVIPDKNGGYDVCMTQPIFHRIPVPRRTGVIVYVRIITYTLDPKSKRRYIVFIPNTMREHTKETQRLAESADVTRKMKLLLEKPVRWQSKSSDSKPTPPITYTKIRTPNDPVATFQFIQNTDGPPGLPDSMWKSENGFDPTKVKHLHRVLRQYKPTPLIQAILDKKESKVREELHKQRSGATTYRQPQAKNHDPRPSTESLVKQHQERIEFRKRKAAGKCVGEGAEWSDEERDEHPVTKPKTDPGTVSPQCEPPNKAPVRNSAPPNQAGGACVVAGKSCDVACESSDKCVTPFYYKWKVTAPRHPGAAAAAPASTPPNQPGDANRDVADKSCESSDEYITPFNYKWKV